MGMIHEPSVCDAAFRALTGCNLRLQISPAAGEDGPRRFVGGVRLVQDPVSNGVWRRFIRWRVFSYLSSKRLARIPGTL